jgi:pectinesterase
LFSKWYGDFATIQQAVNACPDNIRSYIFVKNGTYYGQTTIGTKTVASSKLISLIGESRDGVILTYDKSIPAVATFEETCTFQVYAKNFYAENITFVNSAGNTGQALALYTAGDQAILKNCSLIGYQDTYRSKKGTRAYLLNCWVEGAVDFIYAGGTLIFDNCTLNCTRSGGFVTAPEDAYATVPKASTVAGIFIRLGFVFRNCTIQGSASVPANSFYLGRPWATMPAPLSQL